MFAKLPEPRLSSHFGKQNFGKAIVWQNNLARFICTCWPFKIHYLLAMIMYFLSTRHFCISLELVKKIKVWLFWEIDLFGGKNEIKMVKKEIEKYILGKNVPCLLMLPQKWRYYWVMQLLQWPVIGEKYYLYMPNLIKLFFQLYTISDGHHIFAKSYSKQKLQYIDSLFNRLYFPISIAISRNILMPIIRACLI